MFRSVLMRAGAVATIAVALAAQVRADPADDQFAVAAGHYSRGRWQMAADEFQIFLRDYAEHARAARAGFFLAEAWMQLRRYDQARTQFRAFVSQAAAASPELVRQASFRIAEAAYLLQDFDEACRELERFQSAYPADRLSDYVAAYLEQARLGRARSALAAEDHAAVDRFVAEFNEEYADSGLLPDADAVLAQSLIARKQYAGAIALLQSHVLRDDPPAAASQYLLALAMQGAGRHDESLELLQSIPAEPAGQLYADLLVARASVCKALGRWEDALAPLDEYLSADPSGAQADRCRALRSVCLAALKRFDESRAALDSLRETGTDSDLLLSAIHDVAEAAYRAGEIAWAGELFAELTSDHQPPEVAVKGLAGLAWCQFDMRRYEEADATCQHLLGRCPQTPCAAEILLLRGQSCERLNRPDPALAAYLSLIEQYPASEHLPAALLAAARLQDQLQQDSQAIELYRRLQHEFGDRPDVDLVLYESAWVLRDLGRDTEADELLNRLHQQFPHSARWADATYRLAERAYLGKELDRARALLSALEQSDAVSSKLSQHALYLSAQVAAAAQDWDQVSSPLNRLLTEYPDTPLRLSAEYWIAESVYRQGEYSAAGDRFARLAPSAHKRREPWMVMIPLRHAQCLAQQDQWAEAKQVAAKIAGDFPASAQQHEVDYLLGRCLAADAQFEAARQAYLRVVRSPSGDKTETAGMGQWMFGETYFHD
jgi:TolA-binding protein